MAKKKEPCYLVVAISGAYEDYRERPLRVYLSEALAVAFATEARLWLDSRRERYQRNWERGQADTSVELETWQRMHDANERLMKSNPFDKACDDFDTTYATIELPIEAVPHA